MSEIETKKIRIIIPCHNEEQNVDILINRLGAVLSNYNYSILFIDDGSTDRTLSKICAHSLTNRRIKYISFSRSFGQQNALKAGYDFSLDVDAAITMDGDLQHPPESISEMLESWESGFEIVNTIRIGERDISFGKKIATKFYYSAVNAISENKILENGPDFRLLDKKVVKAIVNFNENNLYLKELIPWLGFNQKIITFKVEDRQYGNSKYSFIKSMALSIRGLTSFSINPLRFSSLLGGFFSILSFLYGLYAVGIFFFTDNAVAGWTSIIASILLFSGIQFILIGIIGEYVGKVFLESKQRPLYLISKSNIDKA